MSLKKFCLVSLPLAALLVIGATVTSITEKNLKDLTATTAPALTDSAVIVLSTGPSRLATLANVKTALGTMSQATHATNADALTINATFNITVVTNLTDTMTLHFTNGLLRAVTAP